MSRFVFATQELSPMTPGGAASVVAGLAAALAVDHRVVVVVAGTGMIAPTDATYRVVPIELPEPDGSISWFVERSRRLAEAVSTVVRDGGADLVEFNDFEAPGLWALSHRAELGLQNTPVVIRFHGPVGAIAAAIGAWPDPWRELDALERLSLSMADAVLVPSGPMAEWLAESDYGLTPERIVVAPPPVPAVVPTTWAPSEHPWFGVFGRLTEQKGVDDLVRAIIPLMADHPALRLRLIGTDGWSARHNRPMSDALRGLLPLELADRVDFLGPMDRQQAIDSLSSAWAVVVPSRYETFCLAAHELRQAGLPVVVPDQPAFAAFRDDFLFYDGSVAALTAVLGGIVADQTDVAGIARRPPPWPGDPTAAYVGALPSPRPPRSQAGLATIAVKTLEGLSPPVPTETIDAWSRMPRSMRPVGLAVRRLVPRRLRMRVGAAIVQRSDGEGRRLRTRRREVNRAMRRGAFGAVGTPDATVVIPCFDQGEYVEGAVLSVFEQTHRSWEIVLVDDGSDDRATVRILDRLARLPRVRLLRQTNRGLPAARNAGMARAGGRFVVPLDADDELCPEFLESMIAALDPHPGAAFAHCWAELFGDVESVWVTRPDNAYWERLSNSVVGCVLLRREAWAAVGGYDETMVKGHEDWEMWTRLMSAGWDRVRVRRALFRYRKHGVSMSVASEAGFEQAVSEIARRHPDLYELSALQELKRDWYPAVSVLGDRQGAFAVPSIDLETVPTVGTVAAAVAAASGKYVVDGRGRELDPDVVIRLIEILEGDPQRAWAAEGAIVMWRRWALIDPSSPFETSDAQPSGDLRFGMAPDPEWVTPDDLLAGPLEVDRHRPEESARIPYWVMPR